MPRYITIFTVKLLTIILSSPSDILYNRLIAKFISYYMYFLSIFVSNVELQQSFQSFPNF